MKSFKKLIAIILIVALIITTIPLGIVADSDVKSGLQTSQSENKIVSDGEPELLYELVEKRDAVTKHFLMSDGTIKACVYPEAVHYKDGTEYLEIDNMSMQ